MNVVVIDSPATEVVSLEEAKAHLRVDFDDDDDLIQSLVAAATSYLDGPNGYLGRSLITQTLEMRTDAFRSCPIDLPYGPVQEILAVVYDDADGIEQIVSDADYRLISGDRLELVFGKSWPAARSQSDAVRIQYIAGYGDTAEDVPEPLRLAVKLLVGAWYENREQTVIGVNVTPLPRSVAVESLISPYRAIVV